VPSVLAIISKAVFERDARSAGVGVVVPLTRYVSKNKGLTPLASGGSLFLVTVRPPDEKLWLVAILESPTHDGENWNSPKNAIPITDVSPLKDRIKFANGAGITAKPGALGMSLQTPRVLSEEDVALLRAASGGAAPAGARAPAAASGEKGHVNAHEPDGVAPCLCRKCLPQAPERVTVGDLALVRDRADGGGRFVWYWLPEAIAKDKDAIQRAVESRLRARARREKSARDYEDLDTIFGDGDDE
jgi:hypothetical protein